MKSTSLSNIIKTIRLVEDRFRAVEEIKALVYNKEWRADEVHYIQKAMEKHYWLFGEKYQLVTAAEPKFEMALRRFLYMNSGVDEGRVTIDDPDKLKEMDIFAVRQNYLIETIDSIVLELKAPHISIGAKQLEQLRKYMRLIRKEARFNAQNMNWEFYIIGRKISSDGAVEAEYDNAKGHGEKYLIHSSGGIKAYVMTWEDVFNSFELRHNFINSKLQLEREIIASSAENRDDALQNLSSSTAVQPPEIILPS
ncbi:hypothetical protein [Deinococcus irradiatisoli]|uniref:hypothetical protein n=1 Tax=Deinococcus irradiatisoli TaxID=2202254 RepID=UPI0011B1F90E|nr:hypothetical protein [Deinococcus irradiatisoli]